jgi:hypothetical protein
VRVPTRSSSYLWNRATNQWTAPTIQLSTYNNQALITQATSLDSTSQRPISRTSYTYDATGHSTLYLGETWNGTSWQNSNQTFISYDAQGRVTQYLDQAWTNGAWVNAYRTQITYNAQGYQTQYLSQIWTNGAWVTNWGSSSTYSFDTSSRLTEVISANWDLNTGVFVPQARYLYTYNGVAVLTSTLTIQYWQNGAWTNSLRELNFNRDAQQRITYSEGQTWDGAAWQLSTRYNYTYAATNPGYVQLTERLQGSTWVNSMRVTYSFDAQNQFTSYSLENWSNNGWVTTQGGRNINGYNATNDLIRRLEQQFDPTANAYVSMLRAYYFNFQSIALATKPAIFRGQVSLYPNPSSSSATLTLAGLHTSSAASAEVVNMLGQVVLSIQLKPRAGAVHQKLNLAGLPAGVYSVCIRTAEGAITKRLVRQ